MTNLVVKIKEYFSRQQIMILVGAIALLLSLVVIIWITLAGQGSDHKAANPVEDTATYIERDEEENEWEVDRATGITVKLPEEGYADYE